MIDLAPHNPYGLVLQSPLIVAPHCAAPLRDINSAHIGAIVSRPAVLRTPPASRTRWSTASASVVFERLPTIKFRSLLELEAKRWSRLSVPVLLYLKGAVDELEEMASRLEGVDMLAGIVVEMPADQGAISVAAVRNQTALPLLIVVPDGQIAHAADFALAGADALVVQGYPQAGGIADGEVFEGLMVGPALVPRTLLALRGAVQTGLPLIALGGVSDVHVAQQCFAAGATAVMVDGALYGDPFAPQYIGAALAAVTAT